MNLDRMRNNRNEVWLNVASSHYAIDDFINLDNHIVMLALDYPVLIPLIPRKNKETLELYRAARKQAPLIRHNCLKPLPVPDQSVDHILCSHFLEHVFPDQTVAILEDFKRALKPGATLHIIVPDLSVLIDTYVERRRNGSEFAADEFVRDSLLSAPSRSSLMFRVLDFVGSFGLQHRWMYDRVSMLARIQKLGLVILEVNETPSRTYRQGDGSVHIVARKPERAVPSP